MKLSVDLQSKVELILGRKLTPQEESSVDSFSDFSKSDVFEIRLLEEKSGVLAISYIRHRLKLDVELNQVISYYASVIQQDISVNEWVKAQNI